MSLVIDRAPDAETLHIGVLGLGYWGPNHVRNLQELTFVRQITACDLAVDRLERVARRFPAVHATTDYEAVLADDSIDAVVIATPVVSHYQLAAAALAAGKHVLVEKPLTASSLDALALIKQAKAADRVLMPGHTFIYSPPVEKIKSLIDSGDLGEIYFVSTSRVNLGLHQPDASVAWDLGPHNDFVVAVDNFGTGVALPTGTALSSVAPSFNTAETQMTTYWNGRLAATPTASA